MDILTLKRVHGTARQSSRGCKSETHLGTAQAAHVESTSDDGGSIAGERGRTVSGLIAFQVQTAAGVQIYTVRPNGNCLQQITYLSGDAVAQLGRQTDARSSLSTTRPVLAVTLRS
jgi:hypothetical protein